jgi:AAHS family benzoate transporter-like MFS transporter
VVIGMLFGALIIGYLGDIFGRKAALIFCLTVFSLSMAACALAPNPIFFAICRTLAGLGLGGMIPTLIGFATEHAPLKMRTLLIGIIFAGYNCGGILAAWLGTSLMPMSGWQALYWVGSLPLVLLVPFIAIFLPESLHFLLARNQREKAEAIARRYNLVLPVVTAEDPMEGKAPKGLRILFTRNNWLATIGFCLAVFMGLFMIFGLSTWLPAIMNKAGYSLGAAFIFTLVFNLGNVFTIVIVGMSADKFGHKPVIVASFMLSIVSFFLLSIKLPLFAVYILFIIAGIGSFGTQTVINAFVGSYYPTRSRTTAVGFALGFGRIGGIIAPTLLGFLEAWRLPVEWNFYTFAIVSVLGALAILLVRVKKPAVVPVPENVPTLLAPEGTSVPTP